MYILKNMFTPVLFIVILLFSGCNKKNPTENDNKVIIETGTVTDIDGNVYKTVKIGDQWWIAENLKVTHYSNGDLIPNVTDNNEWKNLSSGAYCVYNNDENNANTFGYLYNWYTVNDSRKIAPSGWHVPTDEEWKELEMYLGMSPSEADTAGWRGTNEGSKLAGNAAMWTGGNLVNETAFGKSGFAALPGSHRNFFDGSFGNMGKHAYFWSSEAFSTSAALYRHLYFLNLTVHRAHIIMRLGFSVRLVKD